MIPTLGGGGAERQISQLAAEQAQRGWRVHIALRRLGIHEEPLRHSGLAIHQLGDIRGFHPLLIARIDSLIRKIKPDLLQTWLPQMDLCGGLAGLCNSVPWILTERSVSAAYSQKWPFGWLRPVLGRYARAVVANSPSGAEYWIPRVRPGGIVRTVANAISAELIQKAQPITYKKAPGGRQVLLFVGRLSEEKAPGVLLEAIGLLRARRDFHALFIGDGPLRHEMAVNIADGLREHASLLPYQPDWWGYLKTAAALVNISRFEGQPNAVLEAMAGECPLIVSDIPAHRSILDDHSALMVPPNDPMALAAAIVCLLDHPAAARQRAHAAMRRAQQFTIKAAADAYEQVYREISVLRGI